MGDSFTRIAELEAEGHYKKDKSKGTTGTTGTTGGFREAHTAEKNRKPGQPLSLAELRERYASAATAAATASADIAMYEHKTNAARGRYDAAKTLRDDLKRQIAEHPES